MKKNIEKMQDKLNKLKVDVYDLENLRNGMLTDEQLDLIIDEISLTHKLIALLDKRIIYDVEYLKNLGG